MRIVTFGLVIILSLGASGAGDVLQQLKVAKNDAAKTVVSSLANGSVPYYTVRTAFKAASPATRAALTEQVLIWTKAYVNSPQFAKDYAAERESARPQAEEYELSVDEELKQRREQRKAELEESRKNIAEMPAEYRKMAEEGYKAAVAGMKQLDTPEFRKMEKDALIAERKQDGENHEERLEQWNEAYPENPKELVKQRLEEFLEMTEDVDFDATLNGRRFADKQYERKPAEWKLAYRAGKEATEKARAFATAWAAELK